MLPNLVSDHGPAVAVELIGRRLDRFGADGYGTLVGFVNVINVDGNTPFAALVADAGGNVIVERRNQSASPDGDPTGHAEVVVTELRGMCWVQTG